jgi:hypothetical protein
MKHLFVAIILLPPWPHHATANVALWHFSDMARLTGTSVLGGKADSQPTSRKRRE